MTATALDNSILCAKGQAPIEFIPDMGGPEVHQEGLFDTFAFRLIGDCRDHSLSFFHQRTFSCLTIRLSVLIGGFLYIRPSITAPGRKCQNIGLGQVLKLYTAETHATEFRTRATPTFKADHIHGRRNILHSLLSFHFKVDHFTSQGNLMTASTH